MAKNIKTQQKKREKITPVSYHKEYPTFRQAIVELLEIPGFIGERFSKYVEQENGESSEEGYYPFVIERAVACMMYGHVPDIETKKNQFWHVNMSMDRCFVKTDKFVGFGWIINKTYKNNKYNIDSVTLTFTSYNPAKTEEEIKYCEENGWITETKTTETE